MMHPDDRALLAVVVLLTIVVILVHRRAARPEGFTSSEGPAAPPNYPGLKPLMPGPPAATLRELSNIPPNSRTGYTTATWRPEWRPPGGPADQVPVVGDTLGPLINGPAGGPHGMTSSVAGRGDEGAYALTGATWSEHPTEGDFYSPADGGARPVHELPVHGGPGYSVPAYNILSEPSHEPLVGATSW